MANRNQDEIRAYQFKEELSLQLEIVDLADLYANKYDMITKPHRTGFYHVIWFQKGPVKHVVDFKNIEVSPNSLLFLNKDTVQIYDGAGNNTGKAILFTEEFFCRTLEDARYLKTTILFHDLLSLANLSLDEHEVKITQYFSLIESELKDNAGGSQAQILQNLMHNLLLSAERLFKNQGFKELEKGPDLDYIISFKELVELSYKEQKRVSFYAKAVGVTEKRLNLATARILGRHPKHLIDDRVMLEAKRLLAHSTDSVKEIGFLLGFDEPTNFIKFFRKHNANTPVEFRALYMS